MRRPSSIPEPDSFQHIALLWCQLSVGQVTGAEPPLGQPSLRTQKQMLDSKSTPLPASSHSHLDTQAIPINLSFLFHSFIHSSTHVRKIFLIIHWEQGGKQNKQKSPSSWSLCSIWGGIVCPMMT